MSESEKTEWKLDHGDGDHVRGSRKEVSTSSNSDHSGMLIVKAELDDDIRRVKIHNQELTFDELVLMLQRVYKGILKPADDIVIKYKDEDGDYVTISDSTDLSFAIECYGVLKLKIIRKMEGGEGSKESKVTEAVGNTILGELTELREKVNKILYLLDQEELEMVNSQVAKTATTGAQTATTENLQFNEVKMESTQAARTIPSPVRIKEFDPLSKPSTNQDESLMLNGTSAAKVDPMPQLNTTGNTAQGMFPAPQQPMQSARYPAPQPSQQQQLQSQPQQSQPQQPIHPPPTSTYSPYGLGQQQYTPSPSQQPYGSTAPVQYPSAPQVSRPADTPYTTPGTVSSSYPQMPPTTMPMMTSGGNVPQQQQQYGAGPPPQQYMGAMSPQMSSYRPPGPAVTGPPSRPPPVASGVGITNPYARSAAVPMQQPVQAFRPQM